MANLFNRKPGRYQRRRRTLPLLIVLGVVATLALAALAGAAVMKGLIEAKTPKADPPPAVQAATETQTVQQTPKQTAEPSADDGEKSIYGGEWRQFRMGGGALVGYYDEGCMEMQTEAKTGLLSITLKEESAARVDMQAVSGSFELLTEEEMQRVAVGILQAYYYDAPATAEIVCADAVKTDEDYTVQLSAPATASAPAATATVRLLKADGRLWYAAALCPEGSDCGELPLVVSRVEIGG